jgi:hypothetical protein
MMRVNQSGPFKSYECGFGENIRYRLWHENLERVTGSRITDLRVDFSCDNGKVWTPMPMKLKWWCRFILLTAADPEWPPEIVVGMGCDDHHVWFDYEDDVLEPHWGRKHSRWRATKLSSDDSWSIRRVCGLV